MTKGERKQDETDLYTDRSVKELVVKHAGKEYVIKYRGLPWAARNRILSESLSVDDKNKGHLDIDKYQRNCLKQMIVEHPFPDPIEVALIKIDWEMGEQLAKIVPSSHKVIQEEQEDFIDASSEESSTK